MLLLCLVFLYFTFSSYSMLLLCLLVPLYSFFSYYPCCCSVFLFPFTLLSLIIPAAAPCSTLLFFLLLPLLLLFFLFPFTLLSLITPAAAHLLVFPLPFFLILPLLLLFFVPLYYSFSYYPCCCSIFLFPFTLLTLCAPRCSSLFPITLFSLIIPAAALSSCSPLLFFIFLPLLLLCLFVPFNSSFSYYLCCCSVNLFPFIFFILIPLLLLCLLVPLYSFFLSL